MESLHAVIAEHRPFVRTALARLGVAPTALDDAEQEVFLVLVRRRDDYDPAYSVQRWLWGISRNVAAAQRRRARRRTGAALADDALTERARAEDRVAVVQALSHLDDDHRAIWLARQEGCTASEIAEDRRVPLSTVQWRLREAQRRLQAAMGRAGRRCRAVIISLPRTLASAMSTGATTVAAAALAAMLATLPREPANAEVAASEPASARTSRSDDAHARLRGTSTPPLEPTRAVVGTVTPQEPTVALGGVAAGDELASSPGEAASIDEASESRPRRSTRRRRAHKPTPDGQVELLEPVVARGPIRPPSPPPRAPEPTR